jgi:flagellar basal-body rod protein FlgG
LYGALPFGAVICAASVSFGDSPLVPSDGALDATIDGPGFFQVTNADGERFYTRIGHFSVDASGCVGIGSSKDGWTISPPVCVPSDAVSIHIDGEGMVSVYVKAIDEPVQVGQIQLARFANPRQLGRIGLNLYVETAESGAADLGNPGMDGFGALRPRGADPNVTPIDVRPFLAYRLAEWARGTFKNPWAER